MATTQSDSSTSSDNLATTTISSPPPSLRQPEFVNMNSFSNVDKLIDDLGLVLGQNTSLEEDTAKLIQELPEGIEDEITASGDSRTNCLPSTDKSSGGKNEISSTHWQSKSSGAPLPLRQPDVNSVPPEVLAALLKNENYGNCGPLVAEVNPASQSWSQPVEGGDERTKTGVNPGSDKVLNPNPNVEEIETNPQNFSFSPLAKEFFPSGEAGYGNVAGASNVNDVKPSDVDKVTSKVSSMRLEGVEEMQGYPNDPNFSSYLDFTDLTPESAYTLDIVSHAINYLNQNPAEFNFVVAETIDMLQLYLFDVRTLENIAAIIIAESTSCAAYTGARLCNELARSNIEVAGENFRNVLLTQCQKRLNRVVEQLEKGEVPLDARGFTQFFGELFMNFKIEKKGVMESYAILGLATLELLSYIVKTKSAEDIKFTAQLLKLVGWELDHVTKMENKIKEFVDKIFCELDNIAKDSNTAESSLRIIESLKALRQRDWDHTLEQPSDVAGGPSAIDTNPIYELPEEYDDDYDESDFFEEDGLYLDDESEEVQALYSEFLQMQTPK